MPSDKIKQDLTIELKFETDQWKRQTTSASKDLDKINQRFKTTANSAEKATKQGQSFGRAMQFLVGLGVADYMKNTALEIDRVSNRMKFATGSVEEFNQAMALSADTANDLGLALVPTQRGLATLQASAKGTSLAGKEIEELFKGISQASGALSLTADETNSVFLAFSQIISKGKVQAEELRSQIGERIPGALEIAQRALGVTGAELDKLLQNGELMADDLLPKLSREFQKTFAESAQENATSLTAQLNKLNNTVKLISASTGKWVLENSAVFNGYKKIAELIEASNIEENVARTRFKLLQTEVTIFTRQVDNGVISLDEYNEKLRRLSGIYTNVAKEAGFSEEKLAEANEQIERLTGFEARTDFSKRLFTSGSILDANKIAEANRELSKLYEDSPLIKGAIQLTEETAEYNKNIQEATRLSKQLLEINKLEDEKREQEERKKSLEIFKQIAEDVGKKQKEESRQRVKELRTEQKAIKDKIRLLKQAQTVDDANQVNFLQAITSGSNKDIRLDIEARTRALGGTAGDVDVAQRNAQELEEQTRLLQNINDKLDVERA